VPVTGGEPKQLTWFTGDDQALNWTPDGKAIVMSSARRSSVGLAAVPAPARRLAAAPAGHGHRPQRHAQAGRDMVAFNRTLPSYWRKGYRGNSNADIAVQDLKTGRSPSSPTRPAGSSARPCTTCTPCGAPTA
jgi:tricorn protease